MALDASEALRRAAERAQRRVELEIAKERVERCLGYEIDELASEQWGWLAVLPKPHVCAVECARGMLKKKQTCCLWCSKPVDGATEVEGSERKCWEMPAGVPLLYSSAIARTGCWPYQCGHAG